MRYVVEGFHHSLNQSGNFPTQYHFSYIFVQAAILYNLKLRHIQEKPYTRTGDVVVAMNPYQWYHHLYQPDQQYYYASRLMWNDLLATKQPPEEVPTENKAPAKKDVPPHVYETSTLAFKGMALWGRPQSILVSGESGAGKTETVKICMHHIAELQHGPYRTPAEAKIIQVVERVLDSNPLLEAFGNAQTLRNDNSSRFGKYTQLQFCRQIMTEDVSSPAKLAGSTCEVYLLEKNRVVHHESTDERTFHIFYELLSAPATEKDKIWEGLKGTTMASFKYVGSTSTSLIEGVSDYDRFFQTVKALEVVGIYGAVLRDLFRSLCVVLQLGNLVFVRLLRQRVN
jgi:myosin heavy subunit